MDKRPDDTVAGGTINQEGLLKFRATRVGRETALAQIIRLVQQAQGSKAPIQALADRVAAVFVPAVIGIALVTFVLWWVHRRGICAGHDPYGRRTGHRLPLRAGPGHAHSHHGRHRQGR